MCAKWLLLCCLLEISGLSFGAEWKWTGKNVVITGASSGIGAHLAVALADQGSNVVGLARRDEKIKDLGNKTKGTIHAYKCDLSKEEEIIKAFQWIETTVGGVDILINNAGVYLIGGLINGTTSDWKETLNVNVLGLSISSREALRSMRKRGDNGHIININSVAGHHTRIIQGLPTGMYGPSKFAITALTESLQLELALLDSDIRVTSISPAAVKTKEESDDSYPSILPEDIADAVMYVLKTRPGVLVSELSIQAVGTPAC